MTPTSAAILGGALFCLCAAFVLFPLAAIIPARLERQWAQDLDAQVQHRKDHPAPTDPSYPAWHKAVFACIAGVVGYAVIASRGPGVEGWAFILYHFSLLLLVAINLKSGLLPDGVVIPTLWLGLLHHTHAGSGAEHLYSAAVGYLAPFLLMMAFKLKTGHEVIGGGDLKTLSMAGAWFGLGDLPLVFGGFVVGGIAWLLLTTFFGKKAQGPIDTGPAHFVAALVAGFGAKAF